MIHLDGNTHTLQCVMSGAPATTNPDYWVSWAELNLTDLVTGSGQGGTLNGVTAVNLLSGISGHQLVVKSLSVSNRDTAAVVLTFTMDVSATDRYLFKCTLQTGETAHYGEDGWYVTDAAGKRLVALSGIGSGDVVGPASAVDGKAALFDGVTGKLIKDSGITLGTAASAATGDFATAAQGATADAAQPALGLTANTFYARSSSGAAANKTITDFGLSLVDDADATAARLTMRLGIAAILGGVNAAMRMLPDVTHPLVRGAFLATGTTRAYKNAPGIIAGSGTSTAVNYGGIAYQNLATAATANTVGTNYVNSLELVTSGATINGYLVWLPFMLPDASYGSGATGCDIFVGVNSSNSAGAVDTSVRIPVGQRGAGFHYSTTLGDTNWQFTVRDGAGASITTTDTGMAFAAQKQYIAFVHTLSGGTDTFWCLLNLTDGTAAYGSTARQHGSTATKETVLLVTRDTVARNIRCNDFWTLMGGAV